MVEGVGNAAYIFNRRPIVFKKLIVFESYFLNTSFMLFALSNFFLVWLSFLHSIKMCLSIGFYIVKEYTVKMYFLWVRFKQGASYFWHSTKLS